MPIFVSYSHKDADFVDKLAAHLIRAKAHVWIDRWELNVGDSLIRRIEETIERSSALVVVLSKAAVESEWCRKEVTAGLLRELEEKQVLLLPALLETCDIPLFLRDKKYADFRADFETGFNDLNMALARFTNDGTGRLEQADAGSVVDWSIEWARDDEGLVVLKVLTVDRVPAQPYTVVSEVEIRLNERASLRHCELSAAGFDDFARQLALASIALTPLFDDFFVLLSDTRPVRREAGMTDPKAGLEFALRVECRRLGQDTGRDIVINLGKQIRELVEQSLGALRPEPSRAEQLRAIMTKYRADFPSA